MVVVKLGRELEMVAVAAPAYLERFGIPGSPRELHQHRCLNYRWPTDFSLYRWEFERGVTKLEAAVEGPLIVNEPEITVRAALDGAGIAYVFEHLVRDPIADGRLVRLLQDWSPAFPGRSEEHTSELQSLMRNSYAVFCLKK